MSENTPEAEKKQPLITIKQCAEETQFKIGTIYEKIARGEIPAIKFGRSIRIRRTDLDAFMDQNRTFSRKEAIA